MDAYVDRVLMVYDSDDDEEAAGRRSARHPSSGIEVDNRQAPTA
jgi:hypothetical protein